MTDDDVLAFFSFAGHAAALTALAQAQRLVMICMIGHWPLPEPPPARAIVADELEGS